MPPPAEASQVVRASSSCMRATSPWIFCAACMSPLMSGILKSSDIGLDLLDAGAEGVEHRLGERVLARLVLPLRGLRLPAVGGRLDDRSAGSRFPRLIDDLDREADLAAEPLAEVHAHG